MLPEKVFVIGRDQEAFRLFSEQHGGEAIAAGAFADSARAALLSGEKVQVVDASQRGVRWLRTAEEIDAWERE